MAVFLSTGANLNNQELLNFRVENGETFVTTSNAYKTPLEGRMIYDKTERVLRYGYKDSSNVIKWATLLTSANFDPSLYALKTDGELIHPTVFSNRPNDISPDGASIVLREVNKIGNVSGQIYNSQCPRLGFNWSGKFWGQIIFATNTFKLVRGANDNNWAGLQAGNCSFSKVAIMGGAASQFMKADGSLDSNVYNISKAYNGGYVDVQLASVSPSASLSKLKCAFNVRTKSFVVAYGLSSLPADQQNLVYWNANASDVITGTTDTVGSYLVRGTCISIDGKMYKYDGSVWEEVHSFAGNVESRIAAIEDALKLGDKTDNVINSWKEVVNFLSGLDTDTYGSLLTIVTNAESNLIDLYENKANKTDVIEKPVTAGKVGDTLVLGSDTKAKWETRKIVKRLGSIVDDRKELDGTQWTIDITELGTDDVTVSLYIKNSNSWEQIIADVIVEEYQEGNPPKLGYRVKVGFGSVPVNDVKAVITA